MPANHFPAMKLDINVLFPPGKCGIDEEEACRKKNTRVSGQIA